MVEPNNFSIVRAKTLFNSHQVRRFTCLGVDRAFAFTQCLHTIGHTLCGIIGQRHVCQQQRIALKRFVQWEQLRVAAFKLCKVWLTADVAHIKRDVVVKDQTGVAVFVHAIERHVVAFLKQVRRHLLGYAPGAGKKLNHAFVVCVVLATHIL